LNNNATYTEPELVELIRQRDQTAFGYFYDNYSYAINGIIGKLVDDVTLREDILQEAFIKIWNNFHQYDTSKGRLFTWVANLARNLTIDTLRSKGYKKQQKISSDENSVLTQGDKRQGVDQYDSIGLRKTVNSLKPDQRIIIDLAYFNGYTQDEIAKEMGIPLGTVKTRMRSAIMQLRQKMETEI
jgi:RNA polymerase sigma-70 factor (ECF subfamily)